LNELRYFEQAAPPQGSVIPRVAGAPPDQELVPKSDPRFGFGAGAATFYFSDTP
jgi:hypothetical protein